MKRDEVENTLRRYRPGTLDAADPEIAEALALAGSEPELARWLERQVEQQFAVRHQFRNITPPAGLLEQIVSEHNAREKIIFRRRRSFLLAAAAMVVVLIGMAFWFQPRRPAGTGFAVYERQMAAYALRGYGMNLITHDPVQIRGFLAQNHAPADYILPAPLQKAALDGCAIENWQGAAISMLCFRTGRPLANGEQNDLWLFVIEDASLPDAPAGHSPQFTKISRLTAVVWHQDGKLYLLGTTADEATLRTFVKS